jgi:hypothetical protein
MSEFAATKARELTDRRHELNAETWYNKYKDQLFESIQYNALNGNSSISIDEVMWDIEDYKGNYLMSRLTSLGYKVKLENKQMSVSW